jgi:hypothetical protein
MKQFILLKYVRELIIHIIQKQNVMLIKFICIKYDLDETKMLEKYVTPYYYMPIIEKEINSFDI